MATTAGAIGGPVAGLPGVNSGSFTQAGAGTTFVIDMANARPATGMRTKTITIVIAGALFTAFTAIGCNYDGDITNFAALQKNDGSAQAMPTGVAVGAVNQFIMQQDCRYLIIQTTGGTAASTLNVFVS